MNSKEKKLQKLWYKKLAKSGFKDVEVTPARGEPTLERYGSYLLRQWNQTSSQLEARQRYFELARQFYWDHTFETSKEKEIWKMHSEGLTGTDIANKFKTSKSTAKRIVQRLSKIMLSQRVGDLE